MAAVAEVFVDTLELIGSRGFVLVGHFGEQFASDSCRELEHFLERHVDRLGDIADPPPEVAVDDKAVFLEHVLEERAGDLALFLFV